MDLIFVKDPGVAEHQFSLERSTMMILDGSFREFSCPTADVRAISHFESVTHEVLPWSYASVPPAQVIAPVHCVQSPAV